ncbi:MAG: hypothetical protein PUF65_05485 [Lachnospiraceae bacterium]|nr:hypothetical protein [Lachnospiraceae bacterium]
MSLWSTTCSLDAPGSTSTFSSKSSISASSFHVHAVMLFFCAASA